MKPLVEYPTTPRLGMKPLTCHRFQSSAYRSNQWRYRGRCDSIQFCVDRRIFIVGKYFLHSHCAIFFKGGNDFPEITGSLLENIYDQKATND